jgi:tetratricopeptide (TPR) repeat protein
MSDEAKKGFLIPLRSSLIIVNEVSLMANSSKIEPVSAADHIRKWQLPIALLLIAGVTVAVYWPVLNNGFIDYDDTDYVTANMMVRQGLTLKGFIWSFMAFHAGNWHPITWLSHMLDIQLFNLNPMGHHADSLLFHVANALLLCLVLERLTGRLGRSMVVALLFALHPLHVESVAWIAERKDVLSTLFLLLTMAAYAWYTLRPSLTRYLPIVVLFALGLMAKQMLVTLPLILLLLDYWPLNRLFPCKKEGEAGGPTMKFILAEKIPLFAISAIAALVTLRAQDSAGALAHGNEQFSLQYAGNALISYVKYIWKMLWPTDLALFYPFDPAAVTILKVAAATVLLAVITAIVVVQRKKRPYLVLGWFWYLITLLPVIGFIRVGSQAMADRYTYVPLIGLFVVVVWGGAEIAGQWHGGLQAAAGMAAITLALLAVLTVGQIRYWQNSYDLYAHALTVVKRNWLAHNNMAILLAQQYRYDEAIRHFRESLSIFPNQAEGFMNLGNAYQSTGNNNAAIDAFSEAVRLKPNIVEGHFRLGYAYLIAGNINLAYREYLRLMRLNESYARPLLDSIRMSERH